MQAIILAAGMEKKSKNLTTVLLDEYALLIKKFIRKKRHFQEVYYIRSSRENQSIVDPIQKILECFNHKD